MRSDVTPLRRAQVVALLLRAALRYAGEPLGDQFLEGAKLWLDFASGTA